MVDRTRSGARCYTVRHINTVEGPLPRNAQGTLCYEVENLGRSLVFVDWDNGMHVPVFPDEILVVEQQAA